MNQISNGAGRDGHRLLITTLDEAAPIRGYREVEIEDLLLAVAETLNLERERLNELSVFAGDGRHGDRMLLAFKDAQAAVGAFNMGDAAAQLAMAGQIIRDPATADPYGNASRYLGQGLITASEHFRGRTGLSLSDLDALLDGLLEGARQDNQVLPGQGTLLDVLVAARIAFKQARQLELSMSQALQALLGAAIMTVRAGETRAGVVPHFKPVGRQDPGMASTQVVLTGIVKGLLALPAPATAQGQQSASFLPDLLSQDINLLDFAEQKAVGSTGDPIILPLRAAS